MVKLLIGKKGAGKTKMIIDLANDHTNEAKGNLVFINKNQRLMCDIKHSIRVVCMEDFPNITNSDEYIGFLYGIISGDHDIETIYIDSILSHADVNLEDIPEFLHRLNNMSKRYEIEFVVSLSADREELSNLNFEKYEVIN